MTTAWVGAGEALGNLLGHAQSPSAQDHWGTTSYGLRRGIMEMISAHEEAVTIAIQQPPNRAREAPCPQLDVMARRGSSKAGVS